MYISENKTLRNVFTPRLSSQPILRYEITMPNFRAVYCKGWGARILNVRDNKI